MEASMQSLELLHELKGHLNRFEIDPAWGEDDAVVTAKRLANDPEIGADESAMRKLGGMLMHRLPELYDDLLDYDWRVTRKPHYLIYRAAIDMLDALQAEAIEGEEMEMFA